MISFLKENCSIVKEGKDNSIISVYLNSSKSTAVIGGGKDKKNKVKFFVTIMEKISEIIKDETDDKVLVIENDSQFSFLLKKMSEKEDLQHTILSVLEQY